MKIKRSIDSISRSIKKSVKEAGHIKFEGQERVLIPSGSALMNLMLSDSSLGAYVPGTIVNIVGDSSSGKTFLLWTIFAEMAKMDSAFRQYRLIYDETESAFFFDAHRLFGIEEKRVERSIRSETVQDFQKNVLVAIEKKQPFIYGLDSLDALSTLEEKARMHKMVTKDEIDGSYKTEKPKLMSELLRNITRSIENTQSIVFIVSQTRDNIGVMFGEKKTRSGGRALRFYCTHELWLAIKSHEKNKEREIGVNVIAKTKKNKLTGKLRRVEFPIYYDYGVDDIGSIIDFLVDEKYWRKERDIIYGQIGGVCLDGRKRKLIDMIEVNAMEEELMKEVEIVWLKIEEEIKTHRKPRYTMNE